MKQDNNIFDLTKFSSKIKDFSDLLSKIEDLDDKKKALWMQIYEHAITDRQNAYMMFTTLVNICQEKTSEHAIHGKTLATYIERMSKANDQLIKLADLVRKAEEKAEEINSDDMYGRIRSR